MGVSYSASLSVGTTADKLFKSFALEVRDVFEIHDVKSGKPTGKMSPGEKWIVAELHDGQKIEQRGSKEFELKDWLEEKIGYRCPINFSYDYDNDNRTLKDLFIGMAVVSGQWNSNHIATPEAINVKKAEVKEILKKIGFTGEIETALVTSCG